MTAMFKRDSADPVILLREGNYKKALKILERMAKRNALDFNTKMHLAEAYSGCDRPGDASAVYLAEAESRLAEGDRAFGIALLKKAAAATPDDEELVKRLENYQHGASVSEGASFSFDLGDEETGSFSSEELIAFEAREAEKAHTADEPQSDSPSTEVEEESVVDSVQEEKITEALQQEPIDEQEDSHSGEEADQQYTDDHPPLQEDSEDTVSLNVEPDKDRFRLLGTLFPTLSDVELGLMEELVEVRQLHQNDVLLEEGHEGDSLFIVSKGSFSVSGVFDEEVVTLAEIGPGSVIGEVSFLKNVPRTATVTALEGSEVMEMTPEKLSHIGQEKNDFKDRLEAILNERIDKTIAMLKQKRGSQSVDS